MEAKGRRRHGQRGQAIVMMAVFMAAAIALVAIVVDVGAYFRDTRKLQALTDAAALGGAQKLPTQGTSGQPCPNAVANAAAGIAVQNNPGSAALTYTCWRSTQAASGFVDQIQVRAAKPTTSGLFSTLGVNVLVPSRESWAQRSALGSGAFVLPLAVYGACQQSNQAPCIGSYNGINYISFHKYGSCAAANDRPFCWTDLSGNPGIPDFGAGMSTMDSWIRSGYPQLITVPTSTYDYRTDDCGKTTKVGGQTYCISTTGIDCGHNATPESCMLIRALQARAGDVVLFPVWRSKGSNNSFNIIGFAVFRLNANAAQVYMRNPLESNNTHWWITGTYLEMDCLPPPEGGSAPDSEHCYGLSGDGADFAARTVRLIK